MQLIDERLQVHKHIQPIAVTYEPDCPPVRSIEQPPKMKFVRSQSNELLRARFKELAAEWHRETDVSSSIHRKTSHPAYLKIIKMDKAALPFILEELKNRPGHWFVALNIITEADPVPTEHYGDIEQITLDWIEYLHNKRTLI